MKVLAAFLSVLFFAVPAYPSNGTTAPLAILEAAGNGTLQIADASSADVVIPLTLENGSEATISNIRIRPVRFTVDAKEEIAASIDGAAEKMIPAIGAGSARRFSHTAFMFFPMNAWGSERSSDSCSSQRLTERRAVRKLSAIDAPVRSGPSRNASPK